MLAIIIVLMITFSSSKLRMIRYCRILARTEPVQIKDTFYCLWDLSLNIPMVQVTSFFSGLNVKSSHFQVSLSLTFIIPFFFGCKLATEEKKLCLQSSSVSL